MLLSLCVVSVAIEAAPIAAKDMPCEYPGSLLRKDGEVIRFKSVEIKERATHRVDVSASFRRVDIKGTTVVDVLVGPSGKVICLRTLYGHPIIRREVEKALREWTFKPEEMSGKPVAYIGQLEFSFCNISCGENGISMTLLK